MLNAFASVMKILTQLRLVSALAFVLFFSLEGTLLAQIRLVRGPYLQLGRKDGMTVVWYTNIPTDSCVQYKLSQSPWKEQCDPRSVTRHEITLNGLQPGMTYSYNVMSNRVKLGRDDNKSEFQFQTNKPDNAPFRFVAFGDCATGTRYQQAVADRILNLDPKPDFAIITGDIVYDYGADEDYPLKFFRPYKDLIDRFVFYPTLGNHDVYTDNGQPYLNVFSLPKNGPEGVPPKRNYTFDYGNARFVAIDSNASPEVLRNNIIPWVDRSLTHTLKRWKLAFFHHAPYSSGPNSESQEVAVVRDALPGILSAKGVDIVFNGHDHLYERTKSMGGVIYIVTGAGGHTIMYPRQYNRNYTESFYGRDNGKHSFTRVDVSGNTLTLKQIDISNCQVDTLVLEKPVAEFDLWKYWTGTTFPGDGWKHLEFDDSHWRGFVYRDKYDALSLDRTGDTPFTIYQRKIFSVPNAARIKELKLRVDYDDGFVAYINGVEVARRNVPQNQTNTTPASARREAGAFETFGINPNVLVNGKNIIAMEKHSVDSRGTDLPLIVELTMSYTEPPYCP